MTVRGRGGFILAVAIAICFAMVVIALVVANQNRSMVGFARNTQAESVQTEGAQWAFANLRGLLQNNYTGSGQPFTLPAGPVTGNYTHAPINTTDGSVRLNLRLTHRALGNVSDVDSYTGPQAASSASSINVPPCHSSAVLTAVMEADPGAGTNKYLTMYSGNHPYALISETGAVSAQSVRSVTSHTATNISGLMAHVYGRSGVAVSGRLNGRAYSGGTVTLGSLGVPYANWSNPLVIPADFKSQLATFRTSVTNGLDSNLRQAFEAMHTALHRDFTAENVSQTAAHNIGPGVPTPPLFSSTGGQSTSQETVTKSSMGNTDYDTLTGTLDVGTSLRIPGGAKETLSFVQVNISGDLYLEDDTVLHLAGDLSVSGSIRMGQRATLDVVGSVTASALSLNYSPADRGITSTISNGGTLTLSNAMNRQGNVLFVPIIPMQRTTPFPSSFTMTYTAPGTPPVVTTQTRPNSILNTAFTTKAGLDYASILAKGLPQYLGSVNSASLADTTDVPGALLVSDTRVQVPAGSRLAGLVFAPVIDVGAGTLVGAAWATGAVTVKDLRFFPYFTHAFAHVATANLTVGALEQHPTGFGKLP